MQICKNIEQIRVSKGLGVTEMAKRLGIARTTYANFEKETEPSVDRIKSIAEVLGVHYVEIIDGPGSEVPTIPKSDDREIEIKIKRSDIETLRVSLNALGKVFQHAFQLETDKPQGPPSGTQPSGSIRPLRLKLKKGGKKGSVIEKDKSGRGIGS